MSGFLCPACDTIYSRLDNLYQHVKWRHPGYVAANGGVFARRAPTSTALPSAGKAETTANGLSTDTQRTGQPR